MQSETPIKLRVPRQDLATFTRFDTNADAAHRWAESLPVANTRAAAQQLLEALAELNRVSLRPEQRFSIMEALRPNLCVTLQNLSRTILNQPLIMPEEPRQRAEMSDTLYGMLITAYSVVAIEGLQQRDSIRDINPARLVCESVQRALCYAGRKMLLAFQLYRPVEQHGWLTVHQLYALAERQGLARLPVEDPLAGSTTVGDDYLRVLMIGCCKPNQLRQSDLSAIYRGLRDWTRLINVETADGDGLFLVDLESDQPPLYRSLVSTRSAPQCRTIDTGGLISHLEELKAGDDEAGKQGITFDRDILLPSNMLSHLITSLGAMSMRNFGRSSSNQTLALTIGLSGAHFHAAGSVGFEQLLYGADYLPPPEERVATNPFTQGHSVRDVWSEANPEEDFEREQLADEGAEAMAHQIQLDPQTEHAIIEDGPELPVEREFPVLRVSLANASPGGYCLDWSAELPGDIKTGDIAAVQEERGGDWAIAVIRWVSHLEQQKTLVGLELLSPRATAYGARVQKKTGGESAPQRALLLPEIKLVGQPHTLVTPRAGFRERQKVTLLREGEKFHVQLTRQIAATRSYAQFDFRYIKELGDMLAEDKSGPLDASYDSLWSNI